MEAHASPDVEETQPEEPPEQTIFAAPHDVYKTQDLPQDLFLRWWGLLPEEDRVEFVHFYRGDEVLARFVCVLDYLIMAKVRGAEQNLFSLAYYIAARPFPDIAVGLTNAGLLPRAKRAWASPAVQALMDRVKYRETRQAIVRNRNLLARNVEKMLEDAHETVVDESGTEVPAYNMKDRKFAADAASKFLELCQDEEVAIRAERTKLGVEAARKALTDRSEEIDPKALEAYVKLGAKMLGKAKIEEIIQHAE